MTKHLRKILPLLALALLASAALIACTRKHGPEPAVPDSEPKGEPKGGQGAGASAATPSERTLAELAGDIVTWLEAGKHAEVRAHFSEAMSQALSEEQLAQLWVGVQAQIGGFVSQLGTREDEKDGYHIVMVTCQFEKMPMDVRLVFDGERRLSGMQIRPATNASAFGERPQMPKPPFPYQQREVLYDNPADNSKIGGTLTVPAGKGPHPAVLLITGSGAQDRDETLMGHKPFWVIADHLSRNGIAVLRVDDRGVGKTTGDPRKATIETHGGDAEAGVAFLTKQAEIDPAKIGLMGHSEGGIIAALVAGRVPKVAFVISLAGTGLAGTDINPLQVEAMMRATGGVSEQAIADIVAAQRKLMKLVASGAKDDAIDAELKKTLEIAVQHAPAADREQAMASLEARVAAEGPLLKSAWFRSFLKLDPAKHWRRVRCPVLALVGSKDVQVPAGPNLKAIAAALKKGGNKDATTQELPKLNHLFQPADTGLVDEYAKIPITVDPSVLVLMTGWIQKRTGG